MACQCGTQLRLWRGHRYLIGKTPVSAVDRQPLDITSIVASALILWPHGSAQTDAVLTLDGVQIPADGDTPGYIKFDLTVNSWESLAGPLFDWSVEVTTGAAYPQVIASGHLIPVDTADQVGCGQSGCDWVLDGLSSDETLIIPALGDKGDKGDAATVTIAVDVQAAPVGDPIQVVPTEGGDDQHRTYHFLFKIPRIGDQDIADEVGDRVRDNDYVAGGDPVSVSRYDSMADFETAIANGILPTQVSFVTVDE